MSESNKKMEIQVNTYLKCFFTEEDKREMAMEMAHSTNQAAAVEERKKAAMSSFKDEIDQHTLTAMVAARKIADGYEMRDVACSKVIDYTEGNVTVTRLDTGEEVESRRIRDNERQMVISQ